MRHQRCPRTKARRDASCFTAGMAAANYHNVEGKIIGQELRFLCMDVAISNKGGFGHSNDDRSVSESSLFHVKHSFTNTEAAEDISQHILNINHSGNSTERPGSEP